MGLGVEQNDGDAARYFRQSCDGGYAPGCTGLGTMLEEGRGIEQDIAEATRLFGLACERGHVPACRYAGLNYHEGNGVAENDTEAVRYFAIACSAGEADDCTNLGTFHRYGRGVPQSNTEAVRYLRMGCEGGNVVGCRRLGDLYQDQGDHAEALTYFDEAIRLDPQSAANYNSRCWARAVWGQELDQALEDCNASLEIERRTNTLDSRGLVNLLLGKDQAAFADYDEAIRLADNDTASSLYGRGMARRRLSENAAAEADIRAALDLNADIAERYAGYGITP